MKRIILSENTISVFRCFLLHGDSLKWKEIKKRSGLHNMQISRALENLTKSRVIIHDKSKGLYIIDKQAEFYRYLTMSTVLFDLIYSYGEKRMIDLPGIEIYGLDKRWFSINKEISNWNFDGKSVVSFINGFLASLYRIRLRIRTKFLENQFGDKIPKIRNQKIKEIVKKYSDYFIGVLNSSELWINKGDLLEDIKVSNFESDGKKYRFDEFNQLKDSEFTEISNILWEIVEKTEDYYSPIMLMSSYYNPADELRILKELKKP